MLVASSDEPKKQTSGAHEQFDMRAAARPRLRAAGDAKGGPRRGQSRILLVLALALTGWVVAFARLRRSTLPGVRDFGRRSGHTPDDDDPPDARLSEGFASARAALASCDVCRSLAPEAIAEHVRQRLGFQIVAEMLEEDGALPLIQLSPEWEETFSAHELNDGEGAGDVALPPSEFNRLAAAVASVGPSSRRPSRWRI